MPRVAPRRLTAVIACALLAAPAAAQAADPPSIGSGPLKIWAAPTGSVQVNVDGRPDNEFFPSSSRGGDDELQPRAGFGVLIPSTLDAWGAFIYGTPFGAPVAGPTVVPGPPATVTTRWILRDGANVPTFELTQILAYRNGERSFAGTYHVKNISNGGLEVRSYVGGDLTIRGSDSGVGVARLDSAPRFVGGLNQVVGGTGVLVEDSPWSRFQSGPLGSVINALTNPDGLTNEVSKEDVDNATAVEWDATIQSQQTATYRVLWRFVNTLGISPTSAVKKTGGDASFDARVGDVNGHHARAGRKVVWSVVGANSTSGPVTTETDRKGRTSFHYVGGAPGEDLVTAYVDRNGNRLPDTGEPATTGTVTWKGLQPPIKGETVNVRPLNGRVLIKLPSGGSSKLHAAAGRFRRLRAGDQIPVGSQLDTRHGKVRLLAVGRPTRSTGRSIYQGGTFNGGRFSVAQRRTGSGLTTVAMRGGGFDRCPRRASKSGHGRAGAARKRKRRHRRLFGRAHGRFRSRGRHSSATVRGTVWSMKDTCSTTTTIVKRGSVRVRDFRRHRTLLVRKGHRYVARAQAKKRRRH